MDAAFKKVKPKEGVVVRFPRSYTIMPLEGGMVPWTGADGRYWRRRVNSGDVFIVEETFPSMESLMGESESNSSSRKKK